MSMINKEISDFRTYAYHENDFKFVSKEDILGKWSVFFFYPADFTFVCPTELEDLADKYEQFRAIGCEVYSVSTDTHFVTKPGMMHRNGSRSSITPCWPTPPTASARISGC